MLDVHFHTNSRQMVHQDSFLIPYPDHAARRISYTHTFNSGSCCAQITSIFAQPRCVYVCSPVYASEMFAHDRDIRQYGID